MEKITLVFPLSGGPAKSNFLCFIGNFPCINIWKCISSQKQLLIPENMIDLGI